MSGGRYEYKQHHIRDIYETIESTLEQQGQDAGLDWNGEPYTNEVYRPDVEQAMKEGVEILKKAYIYAHRIDWFLSGDDGEDNFYTPA
jgi:hypothetical protein